MYFKANIRFNPSSETKIIDVPPTKGFLRVLNFLTAGSMTKQEEHETYTAISILQQLSRVCRGMGINNIVRLSKDKNDFYYDTEGLEDDLKKALDAFELKVDRIESSIFEKLELILEHHDSQFTYLIDIRICRIHKVGEHPIEIHVNGLLNQFQSEDEVKVKEQLQESVFKDQNTYDMFLNEKEMIFQQFINKLDHEFRKVIPCEDHEVQNSKNIIKPKKESQGSTAISPRREAEPIFHGYHGFGSMMMCTMLWSSIGYSQGIHINNTTIVNDEGEDLMSIGEEGIDSHESEIMNPEVEVSSDTNFDASGNMETMDSSSFFDSAFDSKIGGGESSCSNCGSSCGASCGGGCSS